MTQHPEQLDLKAPPFADNGIGSLMFKGGHTYLDEYVFDCDSHDHEPTEFERAMLEDFMAGILNDDAMFGPVRALLALATSQAEIIKELREALERIIPKTQWPTKNGTLYDARSRLDFIGQVCERALSRTPAGSDEARPDTGAVGGEGL